MPFFKSLLNELLYSYEYDGMSFSYIYWCGTGASAHACGVSGLEGKLVFKPSFNLIYRGYKSV